MNRLFSLCAMAFVAIMVSAQTDDRFQFVDEQGNVVADGTVLTINQPDSEGRLVVPLRVKNMSGQQQAVSMYETIDALPNGDYQSCAFGSCLTAQLIRNNGNYSSKNVVGADYDADIETEWMPEEGKYASWTAKLQIHVFNITSRIVFGGQTITEPGDQIIGYGPTVTVNFVYADPASVQATRQTATEAATYYTLSGMRLPAPQKGLVMVRQADGKVVKRLY